MEAAIAREYHTSNKTIKRIAREFGTTSYMVRKAADKFSPADFREEVPMAVIKVEHKWVNHVVELLERRGVKAEVPEDYELIEKFQSKINK